VFVLDLYTNPWGKYWIGEIRDWHPFRNYIQNITQFGIPKIEWNPNVILSDDNVETLLSGCFWSKKHHRFIWICEYSVYLKHDNSFIKLLLTFGIVQVTLKQEIRKQDFIALINSSNLPAKYKVSWEGLHKWKVAGEKISEGSTDLIPVSEYKQWLQRSRKATEIEKRDEYELENIYKALGISLIEHITTCGTCGFEWDGYSQCQCKLALTES